MITYMTCVVVMISTTAPMAPTARTRYPYWQMVEEVSAQIEKRPARPLSINQGLQTPGQEYPFESFRHLRTTDLLRAAREGIEIARLQESLGKPTAEVDQLVLNNINIALEYLPLLVKDQKDIWEILNIIQNQEEDTVLRKFLLERTGGGQTPATLMSISMPTLMFSSEKHQSGPITSENSAVAHGVIKGAEDMYHETMLKLSSHPGEKPEIQAIAINLYFTQMLGQYRKIFASADEVKAALAAGQALDFTSAIKPDSLVSPETRDKLRQQGRLINTLAEKIAGHIAEGSIRDERVQAVTRTTLEQMRGSILGINQENLESYLQGKIPEPTEAFPSMPAASDGFTPLEAKPLTLDDLAPGSAGS